MESQCHGVLELFPTSWFPKITPKLLMRQYWNSYCKEQPLVLCLLLPKPGYIVMDKGEGPPKGPLVPGAGPQS